jgi:serine/threonine-protein kinase
VARGSTSGDLGGPLSAEIGEVIGAYELTELIGRGGMGCVYRGVHQTLGRSAAVKVMHPWVSSDRRYTARLKLEARLVNGLRHPNIVDILDFVQTPAPVRVACIMELVEGPSLSMVLSEQRLEPIQALNVACQLSEALAAVHSQGIVHRDVNPLNIIVVGDLDTRLDHRPSVKLLDFGIAKVTDPLVSELASTHTVVGTPAYMAPEQLAAEEAGFATDVYGLTEVLVEMITGHRPFGESGLTMMRHKLQGRPRLDWPDGLVGRPALEALVLAGLDGDPAERPWLEEIIPRLSALAELQRDERQS